VPRLASFLSNEIEKIQKRAVNIIFPELSYNEALEKAKLPKLAERRDMLCSKLLIKDMVFDPDR